jgi:hypothetical protein
MSIEKTGLKEYFWIEAEDALNTSDALKVIKMEGASNGKAIVSSGRHQRIEGEIKYKFTIAQDGKYTFWGRCFWQNVCSNNFVTRLEGYSTWYTMGEDPLINQWHWISFATIELKKGPQELFLMNMEHGSIVDKFLITSDNYCIPSGLGTSSELFLDFKDKDIPEALVLSNPGSWKIDTSKWCLSLKAVKKSIATKRALISVVGLENFKYSLIFKSEAHKETDLSFYFNYIDGENYESVNLYKDKVSLISCENGVEKTLKEKSFQKNLITTSFRDIAVLRKNNSFEVKSNGRILFEGKCHTEKVSLVGFGSTSGNLYFDNVAIVADKNINFTENFHSTQFETLYERPETYANYFERIKAGRANYWVRNGNWYQTLDGFEAVEGKNSNGRESTILFGDDFWENYTLKVAVKASDEGGIGTYLNYQDSANYYLFKWGNDKGKWKYKLLKNFEGNETTLSEVPANPMLTGYDYWYNLEMKRKADTLIIFIDNIPVLIQKDGTFHNGKVGFFTKSTNGASFDDIRVYPTGKLNITLPEKYEYSLNAVSSFLSTNYADWVPSGKKVIQTKNNAGQELFLSKELFMPSYLYNKKTFFGDFELQVNTSKVPKDINIVWELCSFNNGHRNIFDIVIETNKIYLKKNGKELFAASLQPTDRGQFNIWYVNNKWKFKVGDNSMLEYKYASSMDSVKMSLGYTGIGKGSIFLYEIKINDRLKRRKTIIYKCTR